MPDFPRPHEQYPADEDLDAWVDALWQFVEATPCEGGLLPDSVNRYPFGVRHAKGVQYVKFIPEGMDPFFGIWQPAPSAPAPLLVHVPGYGTEMSTHPQLQADGFNVLHVNPLGYATPTGPDESKKKDGQWPVLPDTVVEGERKGYFPWLANVMQAVRWAQARDEVLPERVSFFGTSQGGGGALLLGSIYRDRGARCVAADVPFLTAYYTTEPGEGAYDLVHNGLKKLDAAAQAQAWRTLGFVDTVHHARRLSLPVLLTAGGQDGVCPPNTIEALFERLPGTRQYTYLRDQGHDYTGPFLPLAQAWFRLYA